MAEIAARHMTCINWKGFFLLQKFKNLEKCQTVLSKEFQISFSCSSQVKVYWKKIAIFVKVDCFLKMKLTKIPRALPYGPSTGPHPGPTGVGGRLHTACSDPQLTLPYPVSWS